jgi:hypothetical protein
MPEFSSNRLGKVTRWAGRAIAFLGMIGFLLNFIQNSRYPGSITDSRIILIGLEIISLAGLVLSWWKDTYACILWFLSSIGILIAASFDDSFLFIWAVYGLPYLVSSIFIFGSWQLTKSPRSIS